MKGIAVYLLITKHFYNNFKEKESDLRMATNRKLRILLKKIYPNGNIDTIFFKSRAKDVLVDESGTETLADIVEKVNDMNEGATKVEDSSTNGNIKINGTETNVYTHPNSGATAGTYNSVTVNAQGHVTAGTKVTNWTGTVSGNISNGTNTITKASTRANLTTGEKLSVSLGKVMKWFADLKSLAFVDKVGTANLDTTLTTAYNNRVTTDKVTTSTSITASGWVADARAVATLQNQINTINSNLGSSNYIARVEFHDGINSLADFVSIMAATSTQQGNSPAVQYFRAFSFKDNSGWTPGGAAWYEGICGFRNLGSDTRYSVSGWVLMHAGDSSAVYVGNISGMSGEYNVYWKDIKDDYIKQYDSIYADHLEIYHATPFIDFHFNKSSADYTSRIIEQVSGTLTVTGKLNVNSTLSQGGTAVALSNHNHDSTYLKLSGGTLTGTVTTRELRPASNRVYNIGTSSLKYEHGYIQYLHSGYLYSQHWIAIDNTNVSRLECRELSVRNIGDTAYSKVTAQSFVQASSKRYKTNIVELSDDDAKKILNIVPKKFDYINGDSNQYGFIAEEINEIQTNNVVLDDDGLPEALDYIQFIPQIVKLIQLQEKRIISLESKIAELLNN